MIKQKEIKYVKNLKKIMLKNCTKLFFRDKIIS